MMFYRIEPIFFAASAFSVIAAQDSTNEIARHYAQQSRVRLTIMNSAEGVNSKY